jgi:hypothetical protein
MIPPKVTCRAAVLGVKPLPVIVITVPAGPWVVAPREMVAVDALTVLTSNGIAIEINRIAVSIATVDFLNLFKLFIFFYSPIFSPFFHRVKVNLWVSRYLILL